MKQTLIFYKDGKIEGYNSIKSKMDQKFKEVVENNGIIILYDGKLYINNIPEGELENATRFIESMVRQWQFKYEVVRPWQFKYEVVKENNITEN